MADETMQRDTSMKMMPRRIPLNGTFELTLRCNLHCKMCMLRHADSENASMMERELTAQQWVDMARQAADSGTLNLLITGGEPLLRPDFCEIWEGIYKQGFLTTLFTNATLVTPEIMETLRKYPPHRIGITIYGASPEVYERVCGNADAFEMAKEGTKDLLTLPSSFEFRSTIIKENFDDVSNIEAFIRREFGWNGVVQMPRTVFPAVRGGCSDVPSVRLDPVDNIRLMFHRGVDYLREKVGSSFDPGNLHYEFHTDLDNAEYREHYTLLGCDAGMSSYTISYDGRMLACQLMDVSSVDARTVPLAEAWERLPYTVRIPPMNDRCAACKDAVHCQNCYASRLAESGSLTGWCEYECEDAQEIVRLIKGDK